MNWMQEKRYRSLFHHWTDHICSVNFKKIPSWALKDMGITEEKIKSIEDKPCCFCGRQGILMLNEGFELWESSRDILMALDRIPHSLLEDIYKMELKRYEGVVPDPDQVDDPGEKVRRIIYYLFLPNLITAHRTSGRKHI